MKYSLLVLKQSQYAEGIQKTICADLRFLLTIAVQTKLPNELTKNLSPCKTNQQWGKTCQIMF